MTAEQLKEMIREVVQEELRKAIAPINTQFFVKTLGELLTLQEEIRKLNRRLHEREANRILMQEDTGSEIRF